MIRKSKKFNRSNIDDERSSVSPNFVFDSHILGSRRGEYARIGATYDGYINPDSSLATTNPREKRQMNQSCEINELQYIRPAICDLLSSQMRRQASQDRNYVQNSAVWNYLRRFQDMDNFKDDSIGTIPNFSQDFQYYDNQEKNTKQQKSEILEKHEDQEKIIGSSYRDSQKTSKDVTFGIKSKMLGCQQNKMKVDFFQPKRQKRLASKKAESGRGKRLLFEISKNKSNRSKGEFRMSPIAHPQLVFIEVSDKDSDEDKRYPQRQRMPRMKFWQNQKVIYDRQKKVKGYLRRFD